MKKLIFLVFWLIVFLLFAGFFNPALAQQKVPDIDVYIPGGNVCAPAMVSFFNKSSNLYDTTSIKYKWFVDNGTMPFFVGYVPQPMLFQKGFHSIRVEADSLGFYKGINNKGFNVNGKPTEFLPSNNAQFCPGEEVMFEIHGNISNLVWDFGDGPSTNFDNKHRYTVGKVYQVKVIFDSPCGSDTLQQNIDIRPDAKPTVMIQTSGGGQVCINDEIMFETRIAYKQYSWRFGDGTTSNLPKPTHAYSEMQNYPVTLTATNICNGVGIDTTYINATNNLPAQAQFNYWIEQNSCPNSPIHFNANGIGQYNWSFGDGGTSNQRNPTNTYADTGSYKVTLVLTNGCGNSNTWSNDVKIFADQSKMPPQPNIFLATPYDYNNNDGNNMGMDTLRVCPSEKITFRNEGMDDGAAYRWEMGDGSVYNVRNGEHQFTMPGNHFVKLTLTNNCKVSTVAYKLVIVSNQIKPIVNLKAIPKDFCPSEKAFFFEDGSNSDNPRYTYFINFGDGTQADNIKGNTDTLFKTLATHLYPTAGIYNYKFKAVNTCGNADSIMGQFNVSTNAAKTPFYYLNNSTVAEDKGDKTADWSVRRMPFDSRFVIPVRWDTWPGIDSTLTAFFFWRQFDPANPDAAGDPAGMVSKKMKNIISNGVDTIIAYVPFDVMNADSVGLVVGWYCNHKQTNGMPNAMTTAIKDIQPVKSIKVIPSGTVDIGALYSPGIVFASDAFNGVCTPNAQGNWSFKIADGNYYILRIHEGSYELNQASDIMNSQNSMQVSQGGSNIMGDTIMFNDMKCGTNGSFKFNVIGDKLILNMIYDNCQPRADAISSKQYTSFEDKGNNNNMDQTGCPGDKVKFMLAGGKNCKWDFGDGLPVMNGAVVYHTYANMGKYFAKAIATNACGRIDTMITVVTIGNSAKPSANFDIVNNSMSKGDTLRFKYWSGSDNDINNKYLWNFGDGTTSTLKMPVHVYNYIGGYNVKLTVTNGCGSNTGDRFIQIGGKYDQCNLSAKFYIVKPDSAKIIPNTPVMFMNNSVGSYTNYSWNFSDGVIDSSRNATHTFAKAGLYKICLSVYDVTTGCSNQMCMDVQVGDILCNANFNFAINSTTNTVDFFDKSVNAAKWSWMFQDGKTDIISNPRHQFASAGIYEVCLSISDRDNKCQSQKCQVISVGRIDSAKYCKAEYSYFVDQTTLEVRFKNESLGKIAKGNWSFGDGFQAFDENPIHKYAKPGLYKVCGSIMDSAGCQSVICKDIQVGMVACNADFTYFIDPTNNQVKFSQNDLGSNLIYFWNFGDGQSANTTDPSNTYKSGGRYTVVHSIKDTITQCHSDKYLDIQIGEQYCSAAFNFIVDQQTKTIKFVAKPDSGILTQWNFGDGSIASVANPVHQYTNYGLYQACLTVYNPKNKCTENSCVSINLTSETGTVALSADFAFLANNATKTVQFNDKSVGKIKRYYWNFGDGTSDTTASPTHVYAKAGSYRVCVFVADSMKHVAEQCKNVNISSLACNANFNFIVNPDGLSVKMIDMSSPQIRDQYWDFGNGQFSNNKDAVVKYSRAGVYKVCKSIVDSAGCKASECKEIQLGTLACKANFTNFVDGATKTVQFTDQSVADSSTYFWDFGDGSFSNQKNPTHTYQKAGTYNICQTIKGMVTNCVSDICKEIQVGNVLCEAEFAYQVDALSRTISLQNASRGDFKRFYWENGAGKSDTSENAKFVYTANGDYNVCLHAYNPITNCKSSICKTIGVINDTSKLVRFASDFTYYMIIDSSKIVLTDKSMGDPNKWYWTFGDGSFLKAKDASHKYSKPGVYKVCHTILSANGDFDEKCEQITVGQEPCNLTAGYSLFIDAKLLTVYMSDNSVGNAQKWFWKFGDGSTSYNKAPEHKYSKPGYYMISLSVIDTIKHCTGFFGDIIQVGDVNCKASYDYSVDMSLNELTLKNTSTGNVGKYFWNLGDYSTSMDENPIPYKYAEAGLYRVNLVASSDDGTCRDFYSQAIQVGTINCSADFDYYADSATSVASFKNKAIGSATKYLWLFGDGSTATDSDPVHKYAAPGYYKVGLNTYNRLNGCMNYYDKIILIGREGIDCQADFQYLVDDVNKAVKFYDNSNGKALQYNWNFGDQTAPEASANPTHTYNVGGYYNVCLTVYAENGVQNTQCKMVKVAPQANADCVADFDFNVDTLSRTIQLTDKSAGGVNKWFWNFGDEVTSTDQNPTHVYSKDGYYAVKLVVKNQTSGCTKATVKLINVADVPGLKVVFSVGLDTTKLKGGGQYPVTFTGVTNDGGAKYVWDFGDGSKDSTTNSPTHNYAEVGSYNACVTVSDPVTGQSNQYCQMIIAGPTGVNSINGSNVQLVAYPLPFTTSVTVSYTITENGYYELVVTDIYGRIVKSVAKGTKSSGVYTETIDGLAISSGTYFVQLKNKNVTVKTIILIKSE